MKRSIVKLNQNLPIVDRANGFATDQFRIFLLQVAERGLLIGEGSPNGTVEAQQGAEYMDEVAAPGAVKWIKQKADIGGNRKLGWVAIG